ncbi:MAG TPA: CoA transferase [Gemmatimonadaceae bacterium]|nr:CoA transferase [Gemmatimonadaceae bacterium]
MRVVDFTRVLAGPLCTMLLGDLGADIIKLERTATGDDTRGWGPPFDDRGESAYFLSINRNKKSVAVDLSSAQDRALIAALLAEADVAVDNFKRGTLERYDLSPARFLEQRPALVWCTITGFGPESDRPGYDYVVQAERGWMSITGEADGVPMKVGVALADVVAGKDAAVATLAALAARYRDGRGRHVVTSLARSATAALVNVAQNVLVTGRDAPRWGNAHPNLVPYELFEAADRSIVIAVGNDAQWRACALALGLDDLAVDQRLVTNAGRLEHREELVLALSERLREAPAAHWLGRLAEAGVPAGVVRSVLETLREVEASPLTGVGPSVPGEVRFAPPLLDEHGAEVRRLGWGVFGDPGPA